MNSQYVDVKTGAVVSVIEKYNNIVTLSNGQTATMQRLNDPSFFVEAAKYKSSSGISLSQNPINISNQTDIYGGDYVDPTLFEQSANDLFKQNIITEVTRNNVNLNNGGYSSSGPAVGSASVVVKEESRVFDNGDQNSIPLHMRDTRYNQSMQQPRFNIPELGPYDEDEYIHPTQRQPQASERDITANKNTTALNMMYGNPVFEIFRKAKKVNDVNFSLDIESKIPRTDFIEMMEDTYPDTSIIDYLTDTILQDMLVDKTILRDKIKRQIKIEVYGIDTVLQQELEEKAELTKELEIQMLKQELEDLKKSVEIKNQPVSVEIKQSEPYEEDEYDNYDPHIVAQVVSQEDNNYVPVAEPTEIVSTQSYNSGHSVEIKTIPPSDDEL